MVEQTIEGFTVAAVKKAQFGLTYPLRYFILSMMAGIYVGFGIILIFSIGAPLKSIDAALLKTVMGASFGIALTLVVFAGSELFTGNNMVLTIGSLGNKVKWRHTLLLWTICYAGNLTGSLLIAWTFVASGLGLNETTSKFVMATATAKMTAPFFQLVLRGILCNMLVCLAVWTASRATSDSAKILLIFWCLFAFIGSGFEHSVANMTLLGMTLNMPETNLPVALASFWANILPVTIGNIIGGAIFIGAAYFYIASGLSEKTTASK